MVRRRPRDWRPTPGFSQTRLFNGPGMQETFVDNSSTYTICSSELAQLVADVKALRLAQQVDDILGTPMPRAVYNAETRRYSRGASPCEDRRQPVLSTNAEHWTYVGAPIEDPTLDSDRGTSYRITT